MKESVVIHKQESMASRLAKYPSNSTLIAHLTERVSKLEKDFSKLVQHLKALTIAPEVSKFAPTSVQIPPNSPVATPLIFRRDRKGPPERIQRKIWFTEPHIIAYDLETTGLGKTSEIAIREVAGVSFETNNSFREAVKPWKTTSVSAQKVAPDTPDMNLAKPWNEVGMQFWTWVESHLACDEPQRKIYLTGWNSKPYDSRILMFENQRAGIKLDKFRQNFYFVDLLQVFKKLRPDVGTPRDLATIHELIVGRPVTSAHTALGDSEAVRCIAHVLAREHNDNFWKTLQANAENIHGVLKRCNINT